MIRDDDIKTKDFSIALPGLVNKLGAIQGALLAAEESGLLYSQQDLVGFSLLIGDIHIDLMKISSALYPEYEFPWVGSKNEVSS